MSEPMPEFEELKSLYQDDPGAFEELRQHLIDDCIQSASSHRRKRLQGLQFQIDCRRRLAKNPMATCLEISKMMHQSFDDLSGSLLDFCDLANGAERRASKETKRQRADILPFPAN